MERAPGVVDGFQQRHHAGRGRHVVDEVPAGVAVRPIQPPSHSTVTQSREGTCTPLRAERCVGGVPGHPAFHHDHVVTADFVLQAYLVQCMIGDLLHAPALDADEVGFGEINGHPGRLSVDIGEVAVQDRLRVCGLGGDLTTTGRSTDLSMKPNSETAHPSHFASRRRRYSTSARREQPRDNSPAVWLGYVRVRLV